MKLGFDFGSKNISYVVIDKERVLENGTVEHNGDITGEFRRISDKIKNSYSAADIDGYGITGSIDLPGVRVFDPILASVEAAKFTGTDCRNILSIGCETFYLIRLDSDMNYVGHAVNSDCASGTGGFIDQQAERLGFTTEELALKAVAFEGKAPSIATRCAVFAKSDIIHAQARGFSKEAIAAGLCEGVARSVLANTLKGRELAGDLLFTGGMSRNRKVADEISRSLGRDVVVPDENIFFNAIGAALLGEERDFHNSDITGVMKTERETRNRLEINLTAYPDFNADRNYEEDGVEVTIYDSLDSESYQAYLGIDVGSTSTKAILMDRSGKILAGLYGRTKGDPIKAVSALFSRIISLFSHTALEIIGAGTTGSGRELVKSVLGADLAVNEITAHAKGATFLDPEVDTIIEIGGQDSKFTLLEDGVVTNATMNYVCAAGTGSFIEEQAKRLNITLDEISEMAMGQEAPFTSDRCTVYMERDLNIFLSEGWTKEQIIASVLFSVRDNYLSKVVGKSRIGKKVYFQGATAKNKALVAVFENELNRPIKVSRYCHLTGALGCAVSLMEKGFEKSGFSGVDFSCETSSETCNLCSNQCELRVYTVNGRKNAWGLKCGRDYEDGKRRVQKSGSGFEKTFSSVFGVDTVTSESKITVGIPDALYMIEYNSLFKNFFQRLGVNVIIEKSSDKKLAAGMGLVNADFCAPMALTHGLVESLLKKGADRIFFPTIINEQNYLKRLPEEEPFIEKTTDAYFCFYSSYAPAVVDNLPALDLGKRLISPKLKFNNTPVETVAEEVAQSLAGVVDASAKEIADAFISAFSAWREKKKQWICEGDKILSGDKDKIKILLLGRPYALFDKRINLGIPEKLESMGFDLLNQTMLDLENEDARPDHIDNMHWYFGQQILLATEAAVKNPDVYPIFLTCFRCSPDSYLMTYFKESMEKAGKPYLIIQLDEHSSDVGYMTRIEAGIDTFVSDFESRRPEPAAVSGRRYETDRISEGDTVLIPFTDRMVNRFQKYAFEASGFSAKVLPLDRKMIMLGYRYASGGECLPNIAITGSLIDTIKREGLDPQKTILYLPNLCLSCNFNQYANLIKVGCRNAGIEGVKVLNSNGLQAIPDVSPRINALILSATVLSSLLYKLKYRFQPYESEKGKTAEMVEMSENIVREHILERKSLLSAAKEIRKLFERLPLPAERKPRIGILGDMYSKFNSILNDSLCDYAESLGGEILLPSYNELVVHTMHADIVENGQDGKLLSTMVRYEQRFEKIFEGLLDDSFEPSIEECCELMREFGMTNYIPGETTVSVGRLLYYIKHKVVDAVIHVNPILCCPGVVSSSIFRNIQEKYDMPVIDLFYDGTNKPNKLIVPHMFYLNRKSEGGAQGSEKAAAGV